MRKFDRYLITGATGYLGKTIINKLLSAGENVRALVLPGDPMIKELPETVELTYGNVENSQSMKEFFSGDLSNACLIHCAGIISIASKKIKKLWRVNILGTKHVIDQCFIHGVSRVVHVSTVHAIPEKKKGETITEVSSFSADKVKGQYAKSKAFGTGYALRAAEEGLDLSVVHPSGIIGPYDSKGNISSTILSFCNRELPAAVVGGYDFVDVRDVSDGIIACAKSGKRGNCYILSGHYATLPTILSYISSLGYGKEPKYLPLWLVKMISPFFELGCILRKKPLFLTPYSAYTLGSNALFSHEKASKELGYHPRDLKESLKDTVAWMKEKRLINEPV